jgi:hypothetical protein
MPPSNSKSLETKRRFESQVRRHRLRKILLIAGIAMLVIGVFSIIIPFGLPLSNPAVIPKADPNAGLGLIQSLPSTSARWLGFIVAVLGGVTLGVSQLLADDEDRDNGDKVN